MSDINLLPWRELGIAKQRQRRIVFGGTFLMVTMLIIFSVHYETLTSALQLASGPAPDLVPQQQVEKQNVGFIHDEKSRWVLLKKEGSLVINIKRS